MNGALECTHPPCRRKIYHPSGRCQDHRSAQSERDRLRSGSSAPRSVPTAPPPAVVPLNASSSASNPVVAPSAEDDFTQTRLPDGGTYAVHRNEDGVITREEWKNARGELHREGAPATTLWSSAGIPEIESYFVNGVRHRPLEDGPAVIRYAPAGDLANVTFYVSGNMPSGLEHHAGAFYNRDGSISQEHWDYGLNTFPSRAAVAESLFDQTSDAAREAVLASRFSVLLDEGLEHGRIVEVLAQGVNTVAGVREVLGGAPVEWVQSYEESRAAR